MSEPDSAFKRRNPNLRVLPVMSPLRAQLSSSIPRLPMFEKAGSGEIDRKVCDKQISEVKHVESGSAIEFHPEEIDSPCWPSPNEQLLLLGQQLNVAEKKYGELVKSHESSVKEVIDLNAACASLVKTKCALELEQLTLKDAHERLEEDHRALFADWELVTDKNATLGASHAGSLRDLERLREQNRNVVREHTALQMKCREMELELLEGSEVLNAQAHLHTRRWSNLLVLKDSISEQLAEAKAALEQVTTEAATELARAKNDMVSQETLAQANLRSEIEHLEINHSKQKSLLQARMDVELQTCRVEFLVDKTETVEKSLAELRAGLESKHGEEMVALVADYSVDCYNGDSMSPLALAASLGQYQVLFRFCCSASFCCPLPSLSLGRFCLFHCLLSLFTSHHYSTLGAVPRRTSCGRSRLHSNTQSYAPPRSIRSPVLLIPAALHVASGGD